MKKKLFGKLPVWAALPVLIVLLLGGTAAILLPGVFRERTTGQEPAQSKIDEDAVRQYLAADGSEKTTLSNEKVDEWLREFLASDGEGSVEINRTLSLAKGYDVNGTKTITGNGTLIFTVGSGGNAFRVNERASLAVEGLSVEGNYKIGVAINVRTNARVSWKKGSIKGATEYGVISYGSVNLEDMAMEGGNNWVYLYGGAAAKLTNVNFYKSGSAGIVIEAGATCQLAGEDTLLERTGSCAVENKGSFNMTAGTFYKTNGYGIDNYGTAELSNVMMNRSITGGGIMNEEGAVVTVNDCTFINNKYHVRNLGEMTLASCEMLVSSGSAVYCDIGGVMNISELYIRDTGYHGLYVENSVVTAKNLKCELISYNGISIKGKDSLVNVDGMEVNFCNTAIYNQADAENTYGKVYASGLIVSKADSYNVVSYGGVVNVSNSTLYPSKGYNVYIRSGSSVLDSVKILGTLAEGKGGLAVGSSIWLDPEVVIKGNTEITACMGRGILNNGKITIYNCDVHDNNVGGTNDQGTGLYSLGTVYLYGGKIHNNYATKYGGGIRLNENTKTGQIGKLYMYGGSVYDNEAGTNGGGISVGVRSAVLEMHGGTVTGNRAAKKADGILVNGTFLLYDAADLSDNDIYLYSDVDVVQVASDRLSFAQAKIVPNGYTYDRILVQFKSEKAAAALSGNFDTKNHQFTVKNDGSNGILKNNIADFDTFYDFSGAETVTVRTFAELKEAVESMKADTARVICIAADIVLADTITQPARTDVRLIDDGTLRVLTRGAQGNLFAVVKDSHLVMSGKAGLALDGGALNGTVAEKGLVTVGDFGYFVLEDGAVIRNAYDTGKTSSAGVRGAAVNLAGGYFILDGGTVTNCSSPVDGNYETSYCAFYLSTTSGMSIKAGEISNCNDRAIFSYGKVYMSGGTIDGCSHMKSGGAAFRGTILVMSGGTIQNCVSTNSGSAIFTITSSMTPEGYFLLNGGTVKDNLVGTALSTNGTGGAIYIDKNSVFDFKSGTVSGNVAGDEHIKMSGGGIYNAGRANIDAGAVISKNVATLSYGGIYNTGTMTITGASITDNTSSNIRYKNERYGAAAAIYNRGTLILDGAKVTDNKLGTNGTVYNGAGSLTIKNMTFTGNTSAAAMETTDEYGNTLAANDKGVDLRVTSSVSATLSGKIVATETDWAFRLDKDQVFTLAEDFSCDSLIKLYLYDTIYHGRKVLDGKVTADTVKSFVWTNAPEGYYITADGYVAMYPVYQLDENGEKVWYESVTTALASAKEGTTIYLSRDVKENVKLTKNNMTLSGAYTITGSFAVADAVTTHLTDVVVDGNATLGKNAILGVRGAAQIGGTTNFEEGATVALDAAVTASPVMTFVLPERSKVGDVILTDNAQGALVSEAYLAFDVVYDETAENVLVVGSTGKLEELANVVLNKNSNKMYDTLAQAVAEATEGNELAVQKKAPVNDLKIDKNLTLSGAYLVSGSLHVKDGVTLTLADKISVRTIVLEGTASKLKLSGDWEKEPIADIVVNTPADYAAKGTVILTGDVAHNYTGCTLRGAEGYMLYVNADGNGILTDYAEAVIKETNVRYKTLEEAVAAVAADQTIRLLADVRLESQLVIGLPITIITDGVTDRVIVSTYTAGYPIWIKPGAAGEAVLSGTDKDSRLIIDGQGLERSNALVYCGAEEGTAASLHYVTVTGGNSNAAGGGMYVTMATATIKNCEFIDNISSYATGGSGGGGIYCTGTGTVIATDSVFSGNMATVDNGGAFVSYGRFEVTNCTFADNRATNVGSAIFSGYSGAEAVKIGNCTFENNQAAKSGGAVYVKKGLVEITGTTFKKNQSVKSGGVIYVEAGTAEMTDCKFEENYAKDHGGAVYVKADAVFKIIGSTFKNNQSDNRGGAVYSTGAKKNAIEIKDCSFEANKSNHSSSGGGGAVYVASKNVLKLTGSSFVGNTAVAGFGGAVAMGTGTSEVILEGTVVFEKNTAGKSSYGGGAVMTGSIFTIAENANVSFKENKAETTLGGAIYYNAANTPVFTLGEGATLVMTDNTDKNGAADIAVKDAGKVAQINLNGSFNMSRIYAKAGTLIKLGEKAQDLDKANLTTVYLTGTVENGIRLVEGSDVANTIFAVVAGKAVALSADGYLEGVGVEAALIHEGTITYPASFKAAVDEATDGDTIVLQADITLAEAVTISKGVTITTDGSSRKIIYQPGSITDWLLAVNASGKNVEFKGTSKDAELIFVGTGDTGYQRGLLYLQAASTVTMQYVTMQNANRSGGNGGAIYNSVALTLRDCSFRNCKATKSESMGGAIYVNSGSVQIIDSMFANNQAVKYGGAIDVNAGSLEISGSTFTSNQAGTGGAIYSGKSIKIKESSFSLNKAASGGGGAIHVGSQNTINIESSTFAQNSAVTYGGAVSIGTSASTLNISGTCEFTDNKVKGNGSHFGGALMAPANLNIKAGAVITMTGNECTGYAHGDAISINATSVSAAKFIIESGAALYVWDNPASTDTDNDVCIKGGIAIEPTLKNGGIYSTSASQTLATGQALAVAMLRGVQLPGMYFPLSWNVKNNRASKAVEWRSL